MVWDRDLYLEEACKQLCDDRFSHQIDQDATQAQHKEVTNVIGQAISTCELLPQAYSRESQDLDILYAP